MIAASDDATCCSPAAISGNGSDISTTPNAASHRQRPRSEPSVPARHASASSTAAAEHHPHPREEYRRHAVVDRDLDEQVRHPPQGRHGGERHPRARTHRSMIPRLRRLSGLWRRATCNAPAHGRAACRRWTSQVAFVTCFARGGDTGGSRNDQIFQVALAQLHGCAPTHCRRSGRRERVDRPGGTVRPSASLAGANLHPGRTVEVIAQFRSGTSERRARALVRSHRGRVTGRLADPRPGRPAPGPPGARAPG